MNYKVQDAAGYRTKDKGSYRIYDIAIMDVLFTFLLAKFIQYHLLEEWDFLLILVCCFALGIILHKVFCVKTTIDKLLFS